MENNNYNELNLDEMDDLQNYFNVFLEKFLKKIIMDKVDNLKLKEDINNRHDLPINILKVHYRKVNDVNIIHELNYEYNSIILMFDYRKNMNLEKVFSFITSIFDRYEIKYDYQSQKKEGRFWSEEKGILTLHTSLKELLRVYENETLNNNNETLNNRKR